MLYRQEALPKSVCDIAWKAQLLRTNVDTGRRVWTHAYAKSAHWGPMPATCGGLAFTGGTNDRMFHAFDASTGKLLWEFPTDSGITGQPSSFMVDGRQ